MLADVARTSTLTKIKQGLAQHNAMWASAPSGYGKSHVARQYISQLSPATRSAYISLAEATDASTVVASLVTQLHGEKPSDLQYLDDPELQPTKAFLQRLQANTLVHCRSLLIIIDDAHNAENNKNLGNLLTGLIETTDAQSQLLILSRQPPLPYLYHSTATLNIALLEKQDFAVNESEATLLCQVMNPSLNANDIEFLHRLTKGWLVALMLSARHFSPTDTNTQSIPSVGLFLRHRVLQPIEPKTLDLLQSLALMPVISRQTCQVLQLESAWPHIEALIEHIGLADCSVTLASKEYRLHPLLRDELTSSLLEHTESKSLKKLLSKCIAALTEQGEHTESISLLLRLCHWELLVQYLEAHAPNLVLGGHAGIVERTITQLPKKDLDRSTSLKMWLAISQIHIHPLESRAVLLETFDILQKENDQSSLHLCYGFLVQTLRIALDNQRPALDFYQLWPSLNPAKAGAMEFACASIGHLHVLQMSGCEPSATLDLANNMLDTLHSPLPPAISRPMVTSLLSYYVMYTRRRDALVMIEATAGDYFDSQCPVLLRLDYTNWLASAKMFHLGLFEEGLELLDRGIALALDSAVSIYTGIMHMHRVYAALGMQDLERANSALDDLSANRQNVMGQGGYCVSSAAISLHQGEPQRALESIQAAYEIGKKQNIMAGLNWGTTLIAAAHLQANNYSLARKWLHTGLALAKKTNNAFFRIHLLLLLAELRLRQHPWQPGSKQRWTIDAILRVTASEKIQPLAFIPPDLRAELSCYTTQHNQFASYATLLSSDKKSSSDMIVASVSHPDGFDLHFAQPELEKQVSKRVRQLLLILNRASDEGLSLSALCQKLYPVHEPALALSNTRNLIYRTRRQLGRDEVVLVSVGYARLNRSTLRVLDLEDSLPQFEDISV